MVSEEQAEFLLMECEKCLGHPLRGLRRRLAFHDKPYSTLWELITLYCVLPLGSIVHEPEQSCPDICIKYREESHLWIESTYVYSRSRQTIENAEDFIRWIMNRLGVIGITFEHGMDIDIAPYNRLEACEVPDQSKWGELIRQNSWLDFVNVLKDSDSPEVEWICPTGNAIIKLRRPSYSGRILIGLPSIKEPRTPKQHPVYKEIKGKAEQAKRWERLGKLYHPLVLCIGASQNPWEVDSSPSSGVSLRQAIYSALLDVRGMNLAVQANITKRIDGNSLQVSGAEYISAVIVVTVKTSAVQPHVDRFAKASFFVNDQAAHPLDREQVGLLEQIDFDRVEWGPGWEAWEQPRSSKRSENTHVERIRRQWGKASMRHFRNGAFDVELPANVVARLLNGDISHEDLRQQYGDDLANKLRAATRGGQNIIGCEYVDADPKSRMHNCIRFKFGPPKPYTISDPKKGKEGIE